jgi:SAM-dependent methyltransferase
MTDDDTLRATLEALESATNYRNWILGLADPFLDAPVLELGAGRGTFTGLLAGHGAVRAVEPSPELAGALSERFAGDERIAVTVGTADDLEPERRYGSAVMFNVLEHIADDRRALRTLHDRLSPGGHLVLWVPAFQLLHSRFDDLLGHYRRYRLHPLVELVTACGFKVVDARYANAPGWFSWLVGARLLDRIPTSPTVIKLFDRVAVPVVRAAERVVRPPFGQSVFVAARKPVVAADELSRPSLERLSAGSA